LNDPSAKLVAARRANLKRPLLERLPTADEGELARQLDPWSGSKEPVRVKREPKPDGGTRTVMCFCTEQRALQYLVKGALKPWLSRLTAENQFLLRGGRDAACTNVMMHLYMGYDHVCQVDVRRCFPSFAEAEIYRYVPLPKRVTENVVIARHLSLLISTKESVSDATNLLVEARRGIPQGSAVSSVVAEILLAPIARSAQDRCAVVAYNDNFLVMSRSNLDLVTNLKLLRARMQCHPAGPLCPTFTEFPTMRGPFEFLGYEFLPGNGRWHIRPSYQHVEKLDAKMHGHLNEEADPAAALEAAIKTLETFESSYRLSSWARRYAALWGLGLYDAIAL